MPDPLHQRLDSDLTSAAQMASLPVDILADPDDVGAEGWLNSSQRDVIRPERLRSGGAVVAGWGDRAWRTRVMQAGSELFVGPPEPAEVPAMASNAAWHDHAREVLDGHWADGTDEATRARLVSELLALPLRDFRREARALRHLLGAHRSLRRAARRVLLQAVAQHHLGDRRAPHTIATWQVLARLTRTPAAHLSGQSHRPALLHDLNPQCPTARRWSDG